MRLSLWFIFFALGTLFLGCGREDSETAPSSNQRRGAERTISVLVEPISVGNIRNERTYTGTLLPSQRFTVAARTAGLLEQLNVEIGERVVRDQVVGKVEAAEALEDVSQAEAEVAVAEANLISAKAALEVVERELDRIESLRDRDFVSAFERERVETRLISEQANLAVAEATLDLRKSALRRAQLNLDRTILRTSWQGSDEERFVSQRFLDEGSLVSTNSPILEVVSVDPLIGQFFVPESDYYSIFPGMEVKISVGGHVGRQYPAEVRRRAPEFSEDSRRALIEVIVPNPSQALTPGVFMRASVVLAEQSDAVMVPLDAIVKRGETNGVFLIDESAGRARFIPVTLGFQESDKVAVTGLQSSGFVVVLGNDQLVNNTPVRWQKPDSSEHREPAAADSSEVR